MDWDWTALGKALRFRRDALRLTREELGAQSGVHAGTVKNYEVGLRSYDKIPKGVLQIAEALGWTQDSVKAVLEGGQPALTATAAPALGPAASRAARPEAPLAALADRLPTSMVHELENGELFATDVHDLTLDGGLRVFTVVVRTPGQEPRSAEQVKVETEAWYRHQRELRKQQPVDVSDNSRESELR